MENSTPDSAPGESLAIGASLGFLSGFATSLLVSAETIDETESLQAIAITEEPKQWLSEHIDGDVLPITLTVGLVIGGAIGWVAMKARQRGESFTGFGKNKL